ncbi:hypothetical protein Y032_0045g1230 [Ancylostoma ceylanicum]|uniref:Uncharacterized protein n=1 Tax=Ancylostoma ceylanicum TaxID=53326 RepID=A0A016UDT0_9BILA|nr:hypothetical protein Y032_0045g1230 [Ancylostoma ceylanicum]
MGLQWLNAILGFERDRVEARMRRRRARENEHVESESSNDDSSSDSSSNADAQENAEDNDAERPAEDNGAEHPTEDNGAEHSSESTNNGANHAEEGNETSPKQTSASSEAAAAPEAEPMDSLEGEETREAENNHDEEITQEMEETNNDGEEAGANEAEGNAEEETDRENEDHDWDKYAIIQVFFSTSEITLFSFPMREMIELTEFLGETNNRSRAERRGSRLRNNGTIGAGPSRRNGPRSSMSRRAVKRARLAESENHDELLPSSTQLLPYFGSCYYKEESLCSNRGEDGSKWESEKQAEEERDRQKASLKVFGEAFDEALRKLPLPKHLIKFLSLQSITPMFGSNQAT